MPASSRDQSSPRVDRAPIRTTQLGVIRAGARAPRLRPPNLGRSIPGKEWPMSPETENAGPQDTVLVEDLIEEVSIDGMCGVY
ncbi:hypothetical protein GCM10009798_05600 [Nocardioides panacihumi]|uniref:Mycofactocin n=1 Tax=Nocardioides panacihumi TaxID=400774 RepID=A0ABN2QC46_9ACTN